VAEMGTVREPMKGNVRRWELVPEDNCGTVDLEDSELSELQTMRNRDRLCKIAIAL
jgi:hypothetical protein